MDLDKAKENIQPLASGRNASILQASISYTHEELLEKRRQFEKAIHSNDPQCNDLLEPWYNYISWIEQSFPSGGKESGLMEVLSKCLRRFESEERYYQDPRMIKLFIKFLDSQKDSSECYQQLYNAGIGTMVADFYIAWAYCYDSIGQMRKADEIFRRGIECRAQPLDELKEAHQHFGLTVAQRMLYKDDQNTLQDTNRQIEERRSALSSLRAYHRSKVGSIRTGLAIRSLQPGTIADNSNNFGASSSNARISILNDDNVIPNIELSNNDLAEKSQEMPSSNVVRSIVDKARHQENERDPGPWNKVHDKTNKKKLMRQKKVVHNQLGFSIHEDQQEEEDDSENDEEEKAIEFEPIILTEAEKNYNKPFKYPPNFANQNQKQSEWITPITTECQADTQTLPCYNKSMIYPRSNREFQPEELQAYLYYKKRSIENAFTQRYSSVWANDITVPLRLYPNFARSSRPQIHDEVDKFFEPPSTSSEGMKVPLKKIYNIEKQEEFQNEELMELQWRSLANETVIEVEDMDETMCASSNNEQVQRRKSFFPARRSLAIRSIIETHKGNSQSSIDRGINKITQSNDIPEEEKTCIEEISLIEKNVIVEKLIPKLDELNLKNEKDLPSSDFQFKTPALPMKIVPQSSEIPKTETTTTPALRKLPFEIYVEENVDVVETMKKPLKPRVIFEADETFSTQVFNNFIQSQSASTPKPVQKLIKHDFGYRDEMAMENATTSTTNSPDLSDTTASPVDVPIISNSYSPIERQLSPILEISEHGTQSTGISSSKSTNGSQESEFPDVNVIQNTISNCQSRASIMHHPMSGETLPINHKQTPPFVIYVDDTETLPFQLPKAQCGNVAAAAGNFDRMMEREDTNTVGAVHACFQDDKTETVTKMMIVPSNVFQVDRTETIPKLHDSTTQTASTTSTKITQKSIKAIENNNNDDDDDSFECFRVSPPGSKVGRKFNFYETAPASLKKTSDIKYRTVENFPKNPNEKSAMDFLNFFENDMQNFDTMEKSPSNFVAANSTGYANSNMKNVEKNIGNSFFPELSLITETISKSNDNKKSNNESNANNMKDDNNFSLESFSYTRPESQPVTKNVTKTFKQTDNSNFSFKVIEKMHETNTERMQRSQNVQWSNNDEAAAGAVEKSIMSKKNLQSSFLPNDISSNEKSLKTPQEKGGGGNTSNVLRRSPRYSQIPKPISIMKEYKNEDSKKKVNLTKPKIVFNMSKEENSFIPETQEISSNNIESKNQKSPRRTFIQDDGNNISNSLKPYTNSKELNKESSVVNINKKTSSLVVPIFELNDETEMFSTGISMIKNSTMRNSQAKRAAPSLAVTNAEAANSLTGGKNNSNQFKSHSLGDDDMSIYFKYTPRTPVLQIHNKSWSSDSEDAGHGDLENGYLHHEIDLNETNERIHNIYKDGHVNPFDTELINALLDRIDFVNSLRNLKNTNFVAKVPRIKANSVLTVGNVDLNVKKLIAEGAYGTVFRGVENKTGREYAFKQERPPNYWEYYICLQVRNRIVNKELLSAYMHIDYAIIGNNASIFVSPFSTYGSIIHVCNKIKKHTVKNVDEYVVMHLTCELLEIIDHLHATSIIHADIKADNFLLMKKLDYNSREPSLQLIDFGVSIDMKLFKPNQTFTYVHNDIEFKCVEMRENRPWTYQLDLYGVAGIIHVLLFGKYMDIERRCDRAIWMPKTHMPRYINKMLWEPIFRELLNVRDCKNMPNLQQLRSMIKEEMAEKERYVINKIAEFNKALDC